MPLSAKPETGNVCPVKVLPPAGVSMVVMVASDGLPDADEADELDALDEPEEADELDALDEPEEADELDALDALDEPDVPEAATVNAFRQTFTLELDVVLGRRPQPLPEEKAVVVSLQEEPSAEMKLCPAEALARLE